jgi:hypothetical protein
MVTSNCGEISQEFSTKWIATIFCIFLKAFKFPLTNLDELTLAPLIPVERILFLCYIFESCVKLKIADGETEKKTAQFLLKHLKGIE